MYRKTARHCLAVFLASHLLTGSVVCLNGECTRIKVLETIEVNCCHIIPSIIATMSIGLYATGFAKSVVEEMCIKVVDAFAPLFRARA